MFQRQIIRLTSIFAILAASICTVPLAHAATTDESLVTYKATINETITEDQGTFTLTVPYGYVKSIKIKRSATIGEDEDVTKGVVTVSVGGKKVTSVSAFETERTSTVGLNKFVKGSIDFDVTGATTTISGITLYYDYSIPYMLKFSKAKTSKTGSYSINLPKGKIDLVHIVLSRDLTIAEKKNLKASTTKITVGGGSSLSQIYWTSHMFLQFAGTADIVSPAIAISNFGKKFPVKLIEVYYNK